MDDDETGFTAKVWLAIWRTVVQLFYIAIVLTVFGNIRNPDTRVIVAVLGLIYITVRQGVIGLLMYHQDVNVAFGTAIDAIRRKVDDQFYSETSFADIRKMLNKARVPIYFEWAGLLVIFFICIYQVT